MKARDINKILIVIKILEDIELPFSPEEEIDKLMKMPVDWGVETVEAGVDVFLYGRKNDEPAVNGASESLPR